MNFIQNVIPETTYILTEKHKPVI